MQTTTMTSKGQVTVPKEVRQRLGLRQGMRIAFVVEGDHAVLRPATPDRARPASGFGMVKVSGPAATRDAAALTPRAAGGRLRYCRLRWCPGAALTRRSSI